MVFKLTQSAKDRIDPFFRFDYVGYKMGLNNLRGWIARIETLDSW